ncbi:MAG: peptidylprolyl isomerase [Clostridia bacterium]|nr:peptidylprolyl isomerase [Clostridia bacterium]
MKKIISLVIVLLLGLVILTGCGNQENKVTLTAENKVKETTNKVEENKVDEQKEQNKEEVDVQNYDFKSAAEKQMKMPEEGEQIAVMHVKDYGDIYMKFFPEIAPKAVENFVKHSKDGYYNGLTFHRIINEFMIQGGDPKGNGTGGESIWGSGFGTELDYSLVPYRGSLCMAMSSLPNSIGSQFFITQANYNEMMGQTLKRYGYPEGLLEQYKTYGGYLSLYLQYTVFGQVYQGMDIVDKIAGVQTDSNDKPNQDVIIESIEITNYKK